MDYQLGKLPQLLSSKVPKLEVTIASPVTEIEEAVNTARGQYHSTRIMAILESHVNLSGFKKILGVTSVDLYNPSPRADGEGFVFGEARLQGRSGIVSTFRLNAGLPPSVVFNRRVEKEAVHELGHMVGLEHCPSLTCVMHKSENVNDTDAKSDSYCDACQVILRDFVEREI
ncbi:MAG TPA: Zn-dependent protease [Methylomirabilota bacterium]|nr:Zn-dependent protease [Methylomirabilota bacterium]